MRPLEDVDKNGWTVADFSTMMVEDDLGLQQIGRTNRLLDQLSQGLIPRYQPSDLRPAHESQTTLDHSQTADRAKFTLVLTTTLPATPAFTLSSQMTVVLGSIRRRGQRADPAFTISHRTGPQPEVTVWGAISFDIQTPLDVFKGTLTALRHVDDILKTVLLPFLLQYPCLIFQKDNAMPHSARGTTIGANGARNTAEDHQSSLSLYATSFGSLYPV
ncbi:transposable element Tc1 transposase [Trichonephila clavipes]|nr:transposable element Tc1 transposase [Trichonephila clavipes]